MEIDSKYKKFIKFFIPPFILIISVLSLSSIILKNYLGKSGSQEVVLTKDFPNIPVYPKAILTISVSEPYGNETFYQSVWEVDASVPDISAWYMRSLPDSGWIIDVKPADANASDIQNIISIKEEKTLYLGIVKEADGQKVKITAEFFPKIIDEEMGKETED